MSTWKTTHFVKALTSSKNCKHADLITDDNGYLLTVGSVIQHEDSSFNKLVIKTAELLEVIAYLQTVNNWEEGDLPEELHLSLYDYSSNPSSTKSDKKLTLRSVKDRK